MDAIVQTIFRRLEWPSQEPSAPATAKLKRVLATSGDPAPIPDLIDLQGTFKQLPLPGCIAKRSFCNRLVGQGPRHSRVLLATEAQLNLQGVVKDPPSAWMRCEGILLHQIFYLWYHLERRRPRRAHSRSAHGCPTRRTTRILIEAGNYILKGSIDDKCSPSPSPATVNASYVNACCVKPWLNCEAPRGHRAEVVRVIGLVPSQSHGHNSLDLDAAGIYSQLLIPQQMLNTLGG